MAVDLKQNAGTLAAATITLASLAPSATLVAGRQSTAIDNTTNKFLDYVLSGKITVGTTPTAATRIELWCVPTLDDTPTYPDTFGASDANVTVTSRTILQGAGRLVAVLDVDVNTSNRSYPIQTSLAAFFGGNCPLKFALFVVHNTGVALNSTGGNHVINVKGLYKTIT